MLATLNPEIESAKQDGESAARWDFGHVGSDVTYGLMDSASGSGRVIPTRHAMERAIVEWSSDPEFREASVRNYLENCEATETGLTAEDRDAARAYAYAYAHEYERLVRVHFAYERRERLTTAWRERRET